MRIVNFNGFECLVKYSSYREGRTRIQLVDKTNEQPIARATLNYAEKDRISNQFVFIKDYSENKGIYSALLKAKIIEEYLGRFELGYNMVLVCKLNACRVCDENIHLETVCEECANKIIKDNE